MVFVMGCMKLEQNCLGGPELGYSRVFGYYENWNDAVESMHNNICDIHETIYEYGIIEDVTAGLYSCFNKRQLFKWNKERQGFFEIEEPKFFRHVGNLTIG